MSGVTTLLFWLGGVLCEPLSEITLKVCGIGDIAKLDVTAYLSLEVLREELALGQIDQHAYCQKVAQEISCQMTGTEMEIQIKEAFAIRENVLDIINALPNGYQCWIVCDFPRAWFSVLERELYQGGRLNKSNLIFSTDSQLQKMTPDIYSYLIQQVREPKEAVLMIDGDYRRAVSAVKHGYNAALFVDARRLRREFALRRISERTDQMERASVVDYIRREGA